VSEEDIEESNDDEEDEYGKDNLSSIYEDSRYKGYNSDGSYVSRGSDEGDEDYYDESESIKSDSDLYISISRTKGRKKGKRDKKDKKQY
jgi:hypothetical protein